MAAGPSINIRCVRGNFRELPSTFYASVGPSVNFPCRASSRPSVNILCIRGTFRKCIVRPLDLPSALINFLCGCETFREFPCTNGTFCQLSMHPRDLPSTFHTVSRIFRLIPSTLCASKGPFVNFLCICSTFHQLLSTLCASARPSINFPCGCGTHRKLLSILVHP